MSFKSDINRFKDKASDRAKIVFYKVCFDMSESIIKQTPVDSGRAKGNWQPTINSPASGTTNDLGEVSIGKTGSVAAKLKLGDTFYLVNNLPYIKRLNDGWSDQAPAGFVDSTVSRFRQIARKAAKQL